MMPDVTFFSGRFSSTPAPHAINDRLGHDLAVWLQGHLKRAAFDVLEVIAEDYGFGFHVKLEGSHYWVSATQYDPAETDDHPGPTWLIGIDYDPGLLWLWRLRRRPRPNAPFEIASAVHELLANDPSISHIMWWAKGVDRGDPTPQPTAGPQT
jgi:hypothetical protein